MHLSAKEGWLRTRNHFFPVPHVTATDGGQGIRVSKDQSHTSSSLTIPSSANNTAIMKLLYIGVCSPLSLPMKWLRLTDIYR